MHMQETGAEYACKIAPCMVGQQDRHNSIVKEIAIMRQVGTHPNMLACYDAYKDATSYYIIMELCTGGELFDVIAHKVRTPLHDFGHPQKALRKVPCTSYISVDPDAHLDMQLIKSYVVRVMCQQ